LRGAIDLLEKARAFGESAKLIVIFGAQVSFERILLCIDPKYETGDQLI